MKEETLKRIKELSSELADIAKEENMTMVMAHDEGDGVRVCLSGSPMNIAMVIDQVISDNKEVNNAMVAVTLLKVLNKASELKDKDKEEEDGK